MPTPGLVLRGVASPSTMAVGAASVKVEPATGPPVVAVTALPPATGAATTSAAATLIAKVRPAVAPYAAVAVTLSVTAAVPIWNAPRVAGFTGAAKT